MEWEWASSSVLISSDSPRSHAPAWECTPDCLIWHTSSSPSGSVWFRAPMHSRLHTGSVGSVRHLRNSVSRCAAANLLVAKISFWVTVHGYHEVSAVLSGSGWSEVSLQAGSPHHNDFVVQASRLRSICP